MGDSIEFLVCRKEIYNEKLKMKNMPRRYIEKPWYVLKLYISYPYITVLRYISSG
jgi:hypothetical protein